MKRSKYDMRLPNDVLIDILLRLPVKLLGRCKCVCRTWNDLIRDPNFVKIHLNRPLNPVRLLAGFLKVERMPNEGYMFSVFNDEFLSVRQDIRNPVDSFPGRIMPVRSVLGPVNGLYYMNYSYDHQNVRHALWNPTTSEFRELPSPSIEKPRYHINDGKYYGFGSTEEDVRVVYIEAFSESRDQCSASIRLYSLVNDCWKDIEYNSVNFHFIPKGYPLFNEIFTHLNGVYYWVVTTDNRDIMFLFDMKTEVFREVNLPNLGLNAEVESISVRDEYYNSIFMFANKYSNIEPSILTRVHVWEMKEEGIWFKTMTFDPSSTYVSLRAVCYGFWKDDEILIKTGDEVLLYDIISDEIQDLRLDGLAGVILLKYKESLTSVRGGSLQYNGTSSDASKLMKNRFR